MDLRSFYCSESNIGLTGGTGYIGQSLMDLIGRERFIKINLEEIPAGSVIIHLAYIVKNDFEAFLGNARIDNYIFEVAKRKNFKIIYGSTNNVYPFSQGCTTQQSLKVNDYYSFSKISGERLLTDLYNIPYIILRIGDVFGVGQTHGNFFKALEFSIKNQKPLKLYGSGSKIRNYMYVEELTRFVRYMSELIGAEKLQSQILNVAYSEEVSVAEIVKYCHETTQLPIECIEIQHDLSQRDLRTLDVTESLGYKFHYTNFWGSLDDYIKRLDRAALV